MKIGWAKQQLNSIGKRVGPLAAVALVGMFPTDNAHAGAVVNFGEDQSISIGLGLRTDVDTVEKGAPDGKHDSSTFSLDNMRLYVNASLSPIIKATFNTEYNSSTDSLLLLDAIARLEFDDAFNVWVGRMLPPSDRANLDGPFYASSFSYPGVVSQYPSVAIGRDNGADVWGKLINKKLVYVFGAFEGHNVEAAASDAAGYPLFAGRVTYNILDAEDDPAYYTSSTYYGSQDILTFGLAGQYQRDGVGTVSSKGDYTAWNADALFEKKLGTAGTLTLEGAYYQYYTGGVVDITAPASANYTANEGGIVEGKAYLASVAYLIPGVVGWGQFQPVIRYQKFNTSVADDTQERTDFGVNYIIKGHNARVSADYYVSKTAGSGSADAFLLGLQLQF